MWMLKIDRLSILLKENKKEKKERKKERKKEAFLNKSNKR